MLSLHLVLGQAAGRLPAARAGGLRDRGVEQWRCLLQVGPSNLQAAPGAPQGLVSRMAAIRAHVLGKVRVWQPLRAGPLNTVERAVWGALNVPQSDQLCFTRLGYVGRGTALLSCADLQATAVLYVFRPLLKAKDLPGHTVAVHMVLPWQHELCLFC